MNKAKLLEDIKGTGASIDKLDDLINLNLESRNLVPIILEHLNITDNEQDKEFLVRCLGVKGLTEVSDVLLYEFDKAISHGYKWTIGNSISIIVDKSILDKLLLIVKDKKHGKSRQMIVYGLGSYPTKEVKETLLGILDEDELLGHTLFAPGKMKDASIMPYIEKVC